jgi:hypothetical protein
VESGVDAHRLIWLASLLCSAWNEGRMREWDLHGTQWALADMLTPVPARGPRQASKDSMGGYGSIGPRPEVGDT